MKTKLLRKLRKMIEEDFGKECPDHTKECPCCQIHKALTTIEGYYEDLLLDDYE